MATLALPISGLRTAGVAHIEVPIRLRHAFVSGGLAVDWLRSVAEGDVLDRDSDPATGLWRATDAISQHVEDQVAAFDFRLVPARLKKIEAEQNGWHYDICEGLTTSADYERRDAITAEQRAEWIARTRLHFLCTMPFPLDTQPGTLCEPWDGEYAGQQVQAPPGHITVFALNLVYHRGDNRGGNRGVLLKPL